MFIYFLIVRIAAWLGHRKAKLLVAGQARAIEELAEWGEKNVVWFHAASVGEFEQARPVIERLRKEQPEQKILLTFFSPSGYELRKNYAFVDKVVYLPFATRRNAHRLLDTVAPRMAVFVKYEFWPAYLRALKSRNIPTYLICGIFRPGQLFFRWYGWGYRRLLRCFTKLFVQDEQSLALLQRHALTNSAIVGDTRFDRVMAVSKEAKIIPLVETYVSSELYCDAYKFRNFSMSGGRHWKVLVAGSTWPKDEELLARYVQEHEDVKLVLVPHEIGEDHLHWIFNRWQGQIVRYSQANRMNLASNRTLVVDAIGFLSSIYRYGQVAYVGGGFGVGIHNTLEPAVYGMPVLFGPNYAKFREARGLIAAGAARSVRNYSELEKAIDDAFERQSEIGAAAGNYCAAEMGATDSICRELFNI